MMVGLLRVMVLMVPLSWLRLLCPSVWTVGVFAAVFPARRVALRAARNGIRVVPELAVGEGLAGRMPCSSALCLPNRRFLGKA